MVGPQPMKSRPIPFPIRPPFVVLAAFSMVCLLGSAPAAVKGESWLDTVREDVRSDHPDPAPRRQKNDHDPDPTHFHFHFHDDEESNGLHKLAGWFSFYCLTSPIWGPHMAVGDDLGIEGAFPRFPYAQDQPGYMQIGAAPGVGRRFAGRFRTEYAADFDDLQWISGHLLLSTSSRFGLDTGMSRFEESLPGEARDRLWLGDLNLVYRFAQSPRSQWRVGLGMNWLDDPIDTDYGLNFTYGFDFFPRRPWIFSTEIDWGTLGNAELFHFRTTAGAVFRRLESYVGYEYWDIDRSQTNALITGLRLWF